MKTFNNKVLQYVQAYGETIGIEKMDNIIDPEKWDKLMRYMDTLPVIEDIDGGELPDPFIDMKEKKNV